MDALNELREMLSSGTLAADTRKLHKGSSTICMKRKNTISKSKPFIAYDFETTRIKAGTPEPLYLTAFGDTFRLSMPITGKNKYKTLCKILEDNFLLREYNNYRFIAWNGNNFDSFFIARALLESDDWIIKPYLTRTKSLRGMRVVEKAKPKKGQKKLQFEFLDGLSMTGLSSTNMAKLSKFLEVFAPGYEKLSGNIDFDKEEFNPKNPDHREYAERDSEGLYRGMQRANEIVKELTGNELQPTIGNLAIKYFQSRIPDGIECWRAPEGLRDVLYAQLKRGGYCWAQKQYHGPVWKYDLNQAYAAAMRDALLPAGQCARTDKYEGALPAVYKVKMSRAVESLIPFYYRTVDKNLGYFTCGAEAETWITSSEYDHLIADKWTVEIEDGYVWEKSFNMSDMVNDLEKLRFTDPKGSSGPLGTLVKMIGNNAYGKTLEQLEGVDLVFSRTCPPEYIAYMPEQEGMEFVFCKFNDPIKRAYHQPQVGVFITAHVRMLVRQAALAYPDNFIYADTDCVVFDCPVNHLHLDAKKYGAWKQEDDGKDYIFIGKKIYYGGDDTRKAKGLRVKELSKDDYEKWLKGTPPVQQQTQRQNFVKFIGGAEMFLDNERSGTDINMLQFSTLVGDRFIPAVPLSDRSSEIS